MPEKISSSRTESMHRRGDKCAWKNKGGLPRLLIGKRRPGFTLGRLVLRWKCKHSHPYQSNGSELYHDFYHHNHLKRNEKPKSTWCEHYLAPGFLGSKLRRSLMKQLDDEDSWTHGNLKQWYRLHFSAQKKLLRQSFYNPLTVLLWEKRHLQVQTIKTFWNYLVYTFLAGIGLPQWVWRLELSWPVRSPAENWGGRSADQLNRGKTLTCPLLYHQPPPQAFYTWPSESSSLSSKCPC